MLGTEQHKHVGHVYLCILKWDLSRTWEKIIKQRSHMVPFLLNSYLRLEAESI